MSQSRGLVGPRPNWVWVAWWRSGEGPCTYSFGSKCPSLACHCSKTINIPQFIEIPSHSFRSRHTKTNKSSWKHNLPQWTNAFLICWGHGWSNQFFVFFVRILKRFINIWQCYSAGGLITFCPLPLRVERWPVHVGPLPSWKPPELKMNFKGGVCFLNLLLSLHNQRRATITLDWVTEKRW